MLNTQATILYEFKNYTFRIIATSPEANVLNITWLLAGIFMYGTE